MDITIGKKIRRARRKIEITQAKLAEQVGVSRPAIWAWENGIYFPSSKVIPSLIRILNLKFEDFYESNETFNDFLLKEEENNV